MTNHIFAAGVSLVILAAMSTAAFAQRGLTQIPDTDPAAQLKSFKLPEGFEINLWASDPMIAKPIQMNWDAAGRLWVASSNVYPQVAPGQKPDDKIYVLQDTDGDGRADKSTVFADGLLIPTGVIPGDGGAYIANSTELVHVTDTDGDGKGDKSRVMLSGFGTEDTHHILHTFRWGPDGQLYFNQSIYIHSHIETPYGPRRLMAGGIWEFRPAAMRLEVFARGWINAWGHVFDDWGQSFVTDGAGGEGINYAFPGAAFATAHNAKRILHGLNPGQPKHCGVEILDGRHLPDEYRGTIVANDFRGNRVNRFVLSESGSGYASRQAEDLVTSSHVAFRPVDIKMGPDGAIYIADWYNPIIQHGEVDFRDPRRDHEHGRIWRITYKGRPLVERPKLVGASVEELLAALKSPEKWTRDQARRTLQERGAEAVVPALASWVKSLGGGEAQHEHHRLEALWLYQSLDVVNAELLKQTLSSPDHRVRAAAVRVLSHWQDRIEGEGALLEAAVRDEHPRVRLEGVNALRVTGTAEAARAAMLAVEQPMDTNLDYALWLTMRELQDTWLAKFRENPGFFGGSASHLVFALKAIENPAAIDPVIALWREGKLTGADEQAVLELVASSGGAGHLNIVFEQALAASEAPRQAKLLRVLEAAANQRKAKPAGGIERITPLLDHADAAVQAAAARLAGAWGVSASRDKLAAIAGDEARPMPVRQAAVDGLAAMGGGASRDALMALTAPGKPIALRAMAAAGLANVDVDAGAKAAVAVLADAPADFDPTSVYGAFLSRKNGPAALEKALKDVKLPGPIAAAGVRQITTSGQKQPGLEQALNTAGSLAPVTGMLTGDDLAKFMHDVATSGDAARGEAIYRRASLLCTMCHAIAGAGGQVGPDLSSIGASAPVDYIIESMLDPQAKIKEGYHVTMISRKDGGVVAGVVVQKTDEQLLVRDGGGNMITVPVDQIASEAVSPVSLMPPLMSQLRRDEFVDLIKFLAVLGKEGGYTIPKERYVRSWQVLEATPDISREMRANGLAHATRTSAKLPWRSVTSMVSGELPLAGLPEVHYFGREKFVVVRFTLEVSQPGAIGLKLGEPDAVEMWVGEAPVKPAELVTLDLPRGRHAVTLAVRVAAKDRPLRVELVDVPGGGAAQVAPW